MGWNQSESLSAFSRPGPWQDAPVPAQDDDGKALIAYSSERNKVMHVARLTRDFTDVELGFARTMVSRRCKKGCDVLTLIPGASTWIAIIAVCGPYAGLYSL